MPTQSTAERLLVSLQTLLSGAMPPGAKVLRNAILPEKMPAAGVVILRDGDPGPPEVWLRHAYPSLSVMSFDAEIFVLDLEYALGRSLPGVVMRRRP